jgi:metal-dependent amidase/aminoacylase/carboxypeptidase family protein
MSVLAKLKDENDTYKSWRQHLHQYPETSFEEVRTSDYIASLLTSWGVEIHRGLAKTGIVATIKGQKGRLEACDRTARRYRRPRYP